MDRGTVDRSVGRLIERASDREGGQESERAGARSMSQLSSEPAGRPANQPSQAKPSQAKLSRAKPSQDKPSQAKPSLVFSQAPRLPPEPDRGINLRQRCSISPYVPASLPSAPLLLSTVDPTITTVTATLSCASPAVSAPHPHLRPRPRSRPCPPPPPSAPPSFFLLHFDHLLVDDSSHLLAKQHPNSPRQFPTVRRGLSVPRRKKSILDRDNSHRAPSSPNMPTQRKRTYTHTPSTS